MSMDRPQSLDGEKRPPTRGRSDCRRGMMSVVIVFSSRSGSTCRSSLTFGRIIQSDDQTNNFFFYAPSRDSRYGDETPSIQLGGKRFTA